MRGRTSSYKGAQPASADDIGLLGLLSPAALAHWPTVARQLSEAGVLGSVEAHLVVAYCEAYARWSADGSELAKMLIELGVAASHSAQEQRNAPHVQPQSSTVDAGKKPEGERRSPNAIMRRREVEKEVGLSRTTIYQRIKDGKFPAPVKLGTMSVGWRVADIEAFLLSPADYKALP